MTSPHPPPLSPGCTSTMLRAPQQAQGRRIVVHGQVRDADGRPVPDTDITPQGDR